MSDFRRPERDSLLGRARRVATVGANLGAAAAAFGVNRIVKSDDADARIARALKDALGRTKGPLMKIAQLVSTIPDALPPEYAAELAQLQSNAPAMGWPFVKRRMAAELGPGWESRFGSFEREAAHAASLGQVHHATALDGRPLAAKLQYPDMASAVEADLAQLKGLIGLYRSMDTAIDPSAMGEEIADRLREELDYEREAKHMALYRRMLAHRDDIRVPEPIPELSTKRLIAMTWLDGRPLKSFLDEPLEVRNRIAELLFEAWWGPMAHYGVIHGDPHLGNYTFTDNAAQLNLLDFGCVRVFPPRFVQGVVNLYRALQRDDMDAVAEAYRDWGFGDLSRPAVEALTVWARFIYAPMLDDRVRTAADGVSPGEYGRREIMRVKEQLQSHVPVKVPREFVFMDRAAIGLGAAFLHLRAELNFYEMFNAQIDGFDVDAVAARQREAVAAVGLQPG